MLVDSERWEGVREKRYRGGGRIKLLHMPERMFWRLFHQFGPGLGAVFRPALFLVHYYKGRLGSLWCRNTSVVRGFDADA